jgi:hypothetical protein
MIARDHQSNFLYVGMCTHWVEGLSWVDGEYDENTLTIPVVVLSDRFVFVLACSVPNLEFDPVSFEGNDLENIVYADGHHVVVYEFAFTVAQE